MVKNGPEVVSSFSTFHFTILFTLLHFVSLHLLYRRPSNSNLLIHEKEREHPNREGFHTLIRERSNPGLQKESARPATSNSGIYSQLRALMQSIESPGKDQLGKVKR